MNELSIHTIADLQLHVRHHGIPKVPIRGFGRIYDIALKPLPDLLVGVTPETGGPNFDSSDNDDNDNDDNDNSQGRAEADANEKEMVIEEEKAA